MLKFMIYDNIIDKLFFKDDKYNKSNVIKYNLRKKKKYQNIQNYILNRYNDSKSERETLYRIHYHIEETPLCPICKQKLLFYGRHNKIFLSHCSNKCKKLDENVNKKWKLSCGALGTNREKAQQTMISRYGVKNPYQIPEIIHKVKLINKEKVKESIKKQKDTCLKKYGVEFYLQTDKFKEQAKQKCLEKYGVEHHMQSEQIKAKYNWEEITKKINCTKELHGTFNTSKDEELSYELIKEKYPDVIRQYKCERYPFNCDFYIPSLDLFIECQYGWQHGKHPFNTNNKDDINYINKIKDKHTKYYDNVIYNWTVRDVNKRNIAQQNNLNYMEFWNLKELKKWLDNYE